MSTEHLSIGIDFGTTNSAMAWYNPDTGQAEIIRNAEGEEKTPSVVYFGEEETLVGTPALELLEDSDHDEDECDDTILRVVHSIKRSLVEPKHIPISDDRYVTPVEVVAEILGKLKRDAEEGYFDEQVERAVITYPATFDSRQRKVISEAAAKAEFREVKLLEEPVAAAVAFTKLGRKVGRGVLVYDLGGGTFDLAMVAREEGEPFEVAMKPEGDPRCGGNDFDQALYDYYDELARQELDRPISTTEGAVDTYFLHACRKQKERLSYRTPLALNRRLSGGVSFKQKIERSSFEELVEERVEKTVHMSTAMAKRAKDEGHVVDTVVLIGGSTRMPLIRQKLEETFPAMTRPFDDKDYAVAYGAAYHASEVPPQEKYRTALQSSPVGKKELGREDVEHLLELVKELDLSGEQAAQIEREVLGTNLATKPWFWRVFDETRRPYLGNDRASVLKPPTSSL